MNKFSNREISNLSGLMPTRISYLCSMNVIQPLKKKGGKVRQAFQYSPEAVIQAAIASDLARYRYSYRRLRQVFLILRTHKYDLKFLKDKVVFVGDELLKIGGDPQIALDDLIKAAKSPHPGAYVMVVDLDENIRDRLYQKAAECGINDYELRAEGTLLDRNLTEIQKPPSQKINLQ